MTPDERASVLCGFAGGALFSTVTQDPDWRSLHNEIVAQISEAEQAAEAKGYENGYAKALQDLIDMATQGIEAQLTDKPQ